MLIPRQCYLYSITVSRLTIFLAHDWFSESGKKKGEAIIGSGRLVAVDFG